MRTVVATRYVTPLREGGSLPAVIEADAIVKICQAGPDSGPIGRLPPRARFHWLTARRSSIIQMSPVHTGRTTTPEAVPDRLLARMVRLPPR